MHAHPYHTNGMPPQLGLSGRAPPPVAEVHVTNVCQFGHNSSIWIRDSGIRFVQLPLACRLYSLYNKQKLASAAFEAPLNEYVMLPFLKVCESGEWKGTKVC